MQRRGLLRVFSVVRLSLAAGILACGPSSAGTGDGDGDDLPLADGAPEPDAPSCAATSRAAEQAVAPADIIWVVDTSGSMNDERDAVQDALNDFSSFIEGAGIDHRVILLADPAEMTVPPPLGGGPRFLHVAQPIESHDALERLIARYPDYQSFLRPDGVVHIVVVTDDESDWSPAQFETARAALTNPGLSSAHHFHSICSEAAVVFVPPPPLPVITGPCSGGLGAGGADGIGQIYMDMVADKDGVWRSICSSDWGPVFDALAEAATVSATLPCTFELPEPPAGQSLDPARVNFVFTAPSGGPVTVPGVSSAADCGGGQGWYYDDPSAPTRISTCPATCDMLEDGAGGEVDIAFGCATIVP
jgi:hypothetical protein